MALSIVAAVVFNTSANTATVSLPGLPTVADGDKILALWTSNGSTATINTDPAMTPLDALTAVGTTHQVRPYYKDLLATDTGAVFSLTWSVNVKGSAVGLIVRGGALGAPDAIGGPQTDSGADAQLTLPGITPVSNDCLLCALAGTQHTTSGGASATGSWVEQADSVGTTATPLSGVWAGTKQLTGQAGVAQASEDMTYALDGRDGSWVFAIAPASTGQTLAPILDTLAPLDWTTTPLGNSLYTVVDEASPSDADFFTSPFVPAGSSVEVLLAPGTDPASSTGHVLSYRARVILATTHSVTIALMQGSTVIASVTRTDLTSSFVTGTLTLSGTEADSITDYTDLRVRITATAA